MATPQDLKSLKDNWRADPVWDIETTEGFEEHEAELKDYRLEWEKIWKTEAYDRLLDKSKKMGIPDNLDLAMYICGLERQIEDLMRQINRLECI